MPLQLSAASGEVSFYGSPKVFATRLARYLERRSTEGNDANRTIWELAGSSLLLTNIGN